MKFSLLSNTIEDIYLFYINIKNAFYNFFLFIQEVLKFYPNSLLRKVDIELFKAYALKDQFVVSMEEGQKIFATTREELTYGEAIWLSIKKVLDYIQPQKDQVFFDLGCGTGRVCFFASIYYGLNANGIDLLPTFVSNANKIKDKFQIENLNFYQENWLKFNLEKADIIYIAATCLSEETLSALVKKLALLKQDTTIISVTNEITGTNFKTIKKMYLPFSWGKAEVFITKII